MTDSPVVFVVNSATLCLRRLWSAKIDPRFSRGNPWSVVAPNGVFGLSSKEMVVSLCIIY